MPPILPLCPFLSSAVHLFGHLDNLYSSSLPTRSLNDKSHGHWKSTLAKVTASLAEPPSPLPPTPPWGPAWGSRLFETPPVIKSEQELSQMSSFHSSYSTASSLQIKFQLICGILCRTEFVIYAKIWPRNLMLQQVLIYPKHVFKILEVKSDNVHCTVNYLAGRIQRCISIQMQAKHQSCYPSSESDALLHLQGLLEAKHKDERSKCNKES